ISLSNGCVCCTIRDNLGSALDEILEIRPLLDHVIIEASGVAHPAKVALYGQGWPGCSLNAVVVAVDASNIRTQSNDRFVGSLCLEQIRQADLLALTHLDLLPDSQTEQLHDWLSERSNSASLDARALSIPFLLGLENTASFDVLPEKTNDFLTSHIAYAFADSKDHLQLILDDLPIQILRLKGFVNINGSKYLIQRVGTRSNVEATDLNGDGLIAIWPADSCDSRRVTEVLEQLHSRSDPPATAVE
ncbi:MAG: GTP-binding protein, partial [Acidimicrobiales bacterium]|nr:GTP-binding protein [Acidimicrobiales bacterium]